MIRLIGVLVVIIGFLLKIDTLFTVILAGVVTGLVSGLSFNEILEILGTSFVANRAVSLFILTLPVIGILERNGLRQRAVYLIGRLKKLNSGGVATIYLVIRQIAGALAVRMSGHPQFVRPLVNPMAQAAAESKYGEISEKDQDKIKAMSAASENYGNFFGQNLFSGASGILLIASALSDQGFEVQGINVATYSIIMAVLAFIVGAIQFWLFDKKLSNTYKEVTK